MPQPSSHPNAQRPQRSRLRRLAVWILRGFLIAVILGEGLYLARRPLLESWILSTAEAELSAALGSRVELGALAGNWVTEIEVIGVRVSDGHGIVAVEDGRVLVRLDPWQLLGENPLEVLQRVEITAARAEIDLDGFSSAEPDAAESDDFAVATLFDLAPRGVALHCADALLRRGALRRSGSVALQVQPLEGTAPRALRLDAPEVTLRGQLTADGVLSGRLAGAGLGEWIALVTEDIGLGGGLFLASATAQLEPELLVRVEAEVRDLTADGRSVRQVNLAAAVTVDGLRDADIEAQVDGAVIALRGVFCDWLDTPAELLHSLRGTALLQIDDVARFATLLPPELVRLAPQIEGALRGQATWGLTEALGLTLELDGDLRTGALAGSVDLALQSDGDGTRLSALRAHARGAELRALAAAPGLTPRGLIEDPAGALAQEITASATLAVSELAELGLQELGVPEVAGRLTAAIEAEGPLRSPRPRVDVAVEQVSVRATGAPPVEQLTGRLIASTTRLDVNDLHATVADRPLQVSAAIVRGDTEITVESLSVTQRPKGSLELSGRIGTADPAELLSTLLASCELEAVVTEFDPGPWLALAGHADAGGSIGGTVSWRADGAPHCEADLRGHVTGVTTTPDQGPVEFELALRSDAGGTHVSALEIRGAGSELQGQLAAPTLTLRGLLEDAAIGEQEVTAMATLSVPHLERLGLEQLGAPELTGGLRAAIEIDGPLSAPRPRGEIDADDISISGGEVRMKNVSGKLKLEPTRLELHDLTATFEGRPLLVTGALARGENELLVEGLTVSQESSGTVELNGRIGTVDPAALVDALLARCDLNAKVVEVDPGPWLALAGQSGIGGSISGSLEWRAEGTPTLGATLTGTVTGPFPEPGRAVAVDLALRGDGAGLAIERFVASSGGSAVSGDGALDELTPADLLRRPERLWSAPLRVEADITGIALAELDASHLGLSDLGGDATGHLSVSGTLAKPIPALDLRLDHGFARLNRGTRLEDVAGRVRVTEHRVAFEKLGGTIGAGPIEVDGAFDAPDGLRDGWRTGKVHLNVRGQDVLLYRRDGVKLRGDIELEANGPPDEVEVTGTISLHSSKVVSRMPYFDYGSVGGVAVREGIGIDGIELGPGVRVRLDVAVTTAEAIGVRTNVLRGDVTASLRLGGPLSAPTLAGVVSGADSSLILPGCRFRAQTLLLTFEREAPRFPNLNIVASGRRHGYDVQMLVRGRYDRPEILFSSNPPLPAEELVVLVTTGARPETLKQRGARGVGTAVGVHLVDELAQYLFGSEATEAQETFIERFTIEAGTEISAEGTESVVVEFRAVDRFYLQAERDIYEFVNFGIVYRIKFK